MGTARGKGEGKQLREWASESPAQCEGHGMCSARWDRMQNTASALYLSWNAQILRAKGMGRRMWLGLCKMGRVQTAGR
eukprot:1161307-Pelagomonas_calceolata.AAC.1